MDISDVGNPIVIRSVQTDEAHSVIQSARDQNILFVAAGFSGVKVLNISDLNEVVIGGIKTKNALSVTESSVNRVLFVADGEAGLKIIDISDCKKP